MKRFIGLLLALVLVLAACSRSPVPDASLPDLAPQGVRHNGFVVVLKPSVGNVPAVAADLARAHGAQLGFVYEHALKGFSITASPQAAAALARNPRVAYVEPDMVMSIFQTTSQVVPTGIKRIFAAKNTNIGINGQDDVRVAVNVAVIDTGIDFEHPDLNVVGGVNCASGSPFTKKCTAGGDDDQSHGTHVAGTIAALDNGPNHNGIDVVGVAPGARLWAVKVLNSQGSGYTSWIVAGIDWVAANAAKHDIRVANMSLGGSGYSQAQYEAIQGAVNAGVAFAVAAGNSYADAKDFSPAGFNNVLTVSALADFDGEPGAKGSPTCRQDEDDTNANFSNYGSVVDIAAPGVCILSTYPLEMGSYASISGTSMASPHAAGALAILASKTDYARSADGVRALYDAVKGAGNAGWTDNSPDGIKEPLLDVSSTTLFAPRTVAGGGGGGNAAPTASFTHSCTDLTCSFNGSGSSDPDGSISSYAWTFGDGSTGSGATTSRTYASSGTYTVTLSVTDNGGATGSTSKSVSVSSGGGSTLTLTGSSSGSGGSWTATATLSGSLNSSTSGTWNYNNTPGGCTITSGSSCSFSLSSIPKRVSSVTYTDTAQNLSVTISKP